MKILVDEVTINAINTALQALWREIEALKQQVSALTNNDDSADID